MKIRIRNYIYEERISKRELFKADKIIDITLYTQITQYF